MTTAHAGRWRRERTVQRPTSNVSGGRGTVDTEVLSFNYFLAHQDRLLGPETVDCP
jgi:hypothetical protein